jgi:MFS family permease
MTTDASAESPATSRFGWAGSRTTRVLMAMAISSLGDGTLRSVFPLVAFKLTHSAFLVSAVSAAELLPGVLLMLHSGAIVDRFNRGRIMAITMAFQTVLVAGVAGIAFSGGLTWVILTASAFLIAGGDTFFVTALQSSMTELVGGAEANLRRVNGRLYIAYIVPGYFLGPPLGSLLYTLGAGVPILLDSLSFLSAAVLILSIARRASTSPSPQRPSSSLHREILVGVAWLWRQHQLRLLAVAVAISNFVWTGGQAILVVVATTELHLRSSYFGLLLSPLALGGIVGGVAANWLATKLGRWRCLLLLLLAEGLAIGAIGAVPDLVTVPLALFVIGFTAICWNSIVVAYRLQVTPEELLGRVNAAFRFAASATAPLGALVGGLTAHVNLRFIYLFGGVALLLTAAICYSRIRLFGAEQPEFAQEVEAGAS